MFSSLLVLLLCFYLINLLKSDKVKNQITKCTQSCPTQYTNQQKDELCHYRGNSYGPGQCASAARSYNPAIVFEDVVKLCQNATSDVPVAKCLKTLKDQKVKPYTNGANSLIDFCGGQETAYPAMCYSELMKQATNHRVVRDRDVLHEKITEFCYKLEDVGPLRCVENALRPFSIDDWLLSKLIKGKLPPLIPATNMLDALQPCSMAVHFDQQTNIKKSWWQKIIQPQIKFPWLHKDTSENVAKCIKEMTKIIHGIPTMGTPSNNKDKIKYTRPIVEIDKSSNSTEILGYCARASSQNVLVSYKDLVEKLYPREYVDPTFYYYHNKINLVSPAAICYLSLSTWPSLVDKFTTQQKLQACEYVVSERPFGPALCLRRLLNQTSSTNSQQLDDSLTLCMGAYGSVTADCFLHSKNVLSDTSSRLHLCTRARNRGPADCFKSSKAAFNKEPMEDQLQYKLDLCIDAMSDDPARCATGSPFYLNATERIALCYNTPPSEQHVPPKCLKAVEAVSRTFNNAPKKMLGYFYASLLLERERNARELLIHMCSFGGSQSPLASAECLKSMVSTQFQVEDAVRVCINVTTSSVISHISLCAKMLPREWNSTEAAHLCDKTVSRPQVEAAIKCALNIAVKYKTVLSKLEIAELCANENAYGHVYACMNQLAPYISTIDSPTSFSPLSFNLIVNICKESKENTVNAGDCLQKILNYPRNSLTFDEESIYQICTRTVDDVNRDNMSVFSCLEGLNKKGVSRSEVDECIYARQEPTSLKIIKFESSDDYSPFSIAGRRFRIWFQVLDQYGKEITEGLSRDYTLFASINENNVQGAVLWGTRSNTTIRGVLQLNYLIISLPGNVELKINAINSDSSKKTLALLGLYNINVHDDPTSVYGSQLALKCVDIFSLVSCERVENGDVVYNNDFPKVKGYITPEYYLYSLSCLPLLNASWHLDTFMNANGHFWVEYRQGIDSIWTGKGLPSPDQTPLQMLGLDEERNLTKKEVKRAYYRQSLLWHPDRWSSYPSVYTVAVQGVFEMISDAYKKVIVYYDNEK